MGVDFRVLAADLDAAARLVRERGPRVVAAGDHTTPSRVADGLDVLDRIAAGDPVSRGTLRVCFAEPGVLSSLARDPPAEEVVRVGGYGPSLGAGHAVRETVPAALDERTGRGGALWRKLVGVGPWEHWDYRATVAGRTREFAWNGPRSHEGTTTWLAPDEAADLAAALDRTPGAAWLYDRADAERVGPAPRIRDPGLVERVAAACDGARTVLCVTRVE